MSDGDRDGVGDGDGINQPDDDDTPVIAVTITAPPTALPLTRVRAIASVANVADQQVTWTVEPSTTAAAIDANGVFTAPGNNGDYVIRATSVAAPTVSATATIQVTRSINPTLVVNTGTITTGTGMAHQNHLVHASENGEWWLWYETSDDPTHLRTRRSTDFVTWEEGASVDLGTTHGNDGRNIAIADRVIGGNHVVHISVGFIDAQRGRKHVRALLPGGACIFGTPVQTNAGGVQEPDGPAVVITEAGQVLDGSGWDQTPAAPPRTPCGDGDAEIYAANTLETGTTSFDTMTFTKEVLWCVTVRVNARVLFSDGETLYHIYDNGDEDPIPRNFFFNIRRDDGTWLPIQDVYTRPPEVFVDQVQTDINDWTARVIGRQIHAVRRNGAQNDTFEHRLFTVGGEGDWGAGNAIDPSASAAGTGVYLARYGEGAVLVHIADTELRYNFWDGTTWSGWKPLDAPANGRSYLAGSTPVSASERPAIMWMEPQLVGNAIVGAVLP